MNDAKAMIMNYIISLRCSLELTFTEFSDFGFRILILDYDVFYPQM